MTLPIGRPQEDRAARKKRLKREWGQRKRLDPAYRLKRNEQERKRNTANREKASECRKRFYDRLRSRGISRSAYECAHVSAKRKARYASPEYREKRRLQASKRNKKLYKRSIPHAITKLKRGEISIDDVSGLLSGAFVQLDERAKSEGPV